VKNCGQDEHCCYVANAGVCRYLEENTMPDRRYSCSLRRILGSWDAVHDDAGYKKYVQPMWDMRGGSCGEYPAVGELCVACGKTG
jgi:hypothetical protein